MATRFAPGCGAKTLEGVAAESGLSRWPNAQPPSSSMAPRAAAFSDGAAIFAMAAPHASTGVKRNSDVLISLRDD
jgi:hypothetical protein